MSVDKDLKRILKEAKRQGFEVRYSAKGYPMVYLAGGLVAKVAQTPGDWRGRKNAIADLRRAGFVWPPTR